ncbi:hypothetical protein BKA82DRAFT_999963 [Pisolithus tinctorius]|uniref:Secreted protein n=1 Tax=Pisolithus tinctorius Marx 270 TaxID=870435 RepID=A0A0C3PBM8_PISTI|nr:hypothetical protein BKA82DRAFT_999963 [Pisolithus tinctorius]KIO05356.1 hypothetical protein M404DRAFT_999963 [Pisolithus tinctorius Marx 270]
MEILGAVLFQLVAPLTVGGLQCRLAFPKGYRMTARPERPECVMVYHVAPSSGSSLHGVGVFRGFPWCFSSSR